MNETTSRRLTACEDRAAIENLLGLYCRAIDRLDVALLKSLYHPEAIDDHGPMRVNAQDFADKITAMLGEACVYTLHTVTHSVIELCDNLAFSESYYLAVHTVAADEAAIRNFFGDEYWEAQRANGQGSQRHEYLCTGRYLDKLEKREGEWKILQRQITNEWGACRPEQMATGGVPAAFSVASRRDRSDPVYKLLGFS